MEQIRIESLTFAYPDSGKNALQNVTLNIEKGEFFVLFGASGCGKTTLLRHIKEDLTPVGKRNGNVKVDAGFVGFVGQNPENQIVTDTVWHEMAFGLENMGVEQEKIRRRVAETAEYFGISGWFQKKTDTLSGGEKQILALASVTAMQPDILVLDEPTAGLDPIATRNFLNLLDRLHRETGMTVVLSEHRTDEVFAIADRVALLSEGKLIFVGTPSDVARNLLVTNHPMQKALPCATRIVGNLSQNEAIALTVRDGQKYIDARYDGYRGNLPEEKTRPHGSAVLNAKNLRYRYEKNGTDVLRGATLSIYGGEIYTLLGGNGVGKTTLLQVLSGLKKPYCGKLEIAGKDIVKYRGNELWQGILTLLPQNPQAVFVRDNLADDLADLLSAHGVPQDERKEKIDDVCSLLGISDCLPKNPLDMSGGELQRSALAKVLLTCPAILLLDEPTKGLDATAKEALKAVLRELSARGMGILLVTHDIEFSAEISDRVSLLFDGEVLSAGTPREFFGCNAFYTTASCRTANRFSPDIVTVSDAVAYFGGQTE